ncbi:hypothetical protein [Glutamicibacter ardleyensis]|uniref:hypothetical protein n=1 Tax=Glutamicibacter ardleyensis TaxID=225894 RepID=UPI003FD6B452
MTTTKKRWRLRAEKYLGSIIGTLIIGALILSQLMNNAEIKQIEVEGLERIIIGATNNQQTAVRYGQHSGEPVTRSIFSENGVDTLGATIVSFGKEGKPHSDSPEHKITMILEHHKNVDGDFCTIGVSRTAKEAISYDSISQELRSVEGACSGIDIESRVEILWEQVEPQA